jgi:hypothetical protein
MENASKIFKNIQYLQWLRGVGGCGEVIHILRKFE